MHDGPADTEDTSTREAPIDVNAWACPIVEPVPPTVGGDVHVAPFACKMGADPDFEVMPRPFEQRA